MWIRRWLFWTWYFSSGAALPQKNTSVQNNHLRFHTMTSKKMVHRYYCKNKVATGLCYCRSAPVIRWFCVVISWMVVQDSKRDPVDLVTVDYDATLHWRIHTFDAKHGRSSELLLCSFAEKKNMELYKNVLCVQLSRMCICIIDC